MKAPKILSATETTTSVTGKTYDYTFQGNSALLRRCVDSAIENFHNRAQKVGGRLEFHTVDASNEVVALYDRLGNLWSSLLITHTVDMVKHCQDCGADNPRRYVAGYYNDNASLVAGTRCRLCITAETKTLGLHWRMERTSFFSEQRGYYDVSNCDCPAGYNAAACDAFCGPNGHSEY